MNISTALTYNVTTKNSDTDFYKVKIDVNKYKATVTKLITLKNRYISSKEKYEIKYQKCWLGSPTSNVDIKNENFKESTENYSTILFEVSEHKYIYICDKIYEFESDYPVLILNSIVTSDNQIYSYIENSMYSIMLEDMLQNGNFILVNSSYKKYYKTPYEILENFDKVDIKKIPEDAFVPYTIIE